jgi:murein DD-endopeptidase MepM/ murein hydrolase activator NlpD
LMNSMNRARIVLVSVVLFLVLIVVNNWKESAVESPAGLSPGAEVALSQMPDQIALGIRIRVGDTTGGILQRYGLPVAEILAAAAKIEGVDLTQIRPDRALSVLYVDGTEQPVGLRYELDEDRTLEVRAAEDGWTAEVDALEYTSATRRISFAVNRSLWADGVDAGLRGADIVRLAGVFEYEIDFNSEIRDGAEFVVVADQLTPPEGSGAKVKLGDIHAIRMVNDGKQYTAVRFVIGDDEGWYHPDGTGMERPFLRSPLEFSRVSSKFNPKRFHPILKKRRPHNGTDFAARTGTAVRSVAAGTVVYAGTNGGHGRFVKVKHASGIQTSYSHLSRVTVKKGARVNQGERVGLVGSSGLATGPHLHYQMWKNGKYVDAMRAVLPRSKPLPKSKLSAFKQHAKPWLSQLEGEATPI